MVAQAYAKTHPARELRESRGAYHTFHSISSAWPDIWVGCQAKKFEIICINYQAFFRLSRDIPDNGVHVLNEEVVLWKQKFDRLIQNLYSCLRRMLTG